MCIRDRNVRQLIRKLNLVDIDQTQCIEMIDDHGLQTFPLKWRPSKPRKYAPPGAQHKKKQLRRLQYGALQRLLHHSKKDAASTVISGDWRSLHKENQNISNEVLSFWKDSIGSEGSATIRLNGHSSPGLGIYTPATMAELLSALSTMKGSAPGPERVTAKELLGLDNSMILTYVNLLLRADIAIRG